METTTRSPWAHYHSLTDERWEHIVDGHPYMAPFRAPMCFGRSRCPLQPSAAADCDLLVEVEVARGALLEPEALLLGRIA
jgi:hypothetical protein